MTKNLHELLTEVNDNIDKIEQYKTNQVLKTVLFHATTPEGKFILPEGVPPYKKQNAPDGLGYATLYMVYKKMYVFCRVDLKPFKREELFLGALESLSDIEAEILLLIKEQTLDSKYPNLTFSKVKAIFQ